MAQRVAFLVDGFNLYHSVKEAERSNGGTKCRWLDIRALCESYLPLLGHDAELAGVHYFSALATHLQTKKPGVVQRHQVLLRALRSTGVTVELGRFKPKSGNCHHCKKSLGRHEEKESDVAMAVRLTEIALTGACDTAILLTGDTDIAPAIRTAKRLAPNVKVGVLFPYNRVNRELRQLSSIDFKIDATKYGQHQLPDPMTLQDGKQLTKPTSW